jgi:hypothetical protein
MESVEEQLIRREHGLALLLTPPFDRMEPSPGYIRGYVPGVRGERRTVHACSALERAGVSRGWATVTGRWSCLRC